MSTPVQAVGAVTLTTAINPTQAPPASSQAPAPGQAPAPTTVQVARSSNAPLYIYRITDTATGRTLVEIPFLEETGAPSFHRVDTIA